MSPLGNAMGLVNGIERDLYLLEHGYIFSFGKRLGCHVKQFCRSRKQVVADFGYLRLVQRRVKEMGNAFVSGHESAYRIHLVLHEGDQRRNDNGRALHHQGRKLIAQRLSTPGRHEHKCVASGSKMAYDALLIGLERIKTEELFQFGVQ